MDERIGGTQRGCVMGRKRYCAVVPREHQAPGDGNHREKDTD